MPGRASLLAGQYYAHPRNAFWNIVEELFGIPRAAPYALRVRELARTGLAVWDVLAACTRGSSLDSDILPASVVPNYFSGFLASHTRVRTIYFNGTSARQLFERHVLRGLPPAQQDLARIQLPSTSPTNARMTFAAKLRAWQVIGEPVTA
jgi:TDG/mug DNA glycosylase family protein